MLLHNFQFGKLISHDSPWSAPHASTNIKQRLYISSGGAIQAQRLPCIPDRRAVQVAALRTRYSRIITSNDYYKNLAAETTDADEIHHRSQYRIRPVLRCGHGPHTSTCAKAHEE